MEGTSSGTHGAVSTRELAAQITELCGHLNAANRRWLALIAEFDRRQGWSDSLTQSCAHWLNWQCGIALGAAREKVRVAHALEKLPLIGAAMSRGELSYSKVRALTRVACETTESTFLSIALHGTAHHVETIVRQYRRATEAAELSREASQQAGRRVTYYWDDDGSLVLKARLPAETGLLVLRALEAAEADVPLPAPDVPAGTWRPGQQPATLATERLPQAATPRRWSLRDRRRPGDSRRDGTSAGVRFQRHQCRRGRCRRTAGRRPSHPLHSAGAAPCVERTGSRLPLPWLHAHALRGRPSRPPLGRRRRDEAVESRLAVPVPPPPGPRGAHRHRTPRRRRLALRKARW
jgi:hypothetical protein